MDEIEEASEVSKLQGIITLQMFMIDRLLAAYWQKRNRVIELEKEVADKSADLIRTRRKVDKLFMDLGVWWQSIFDTGDNDELTLEQCRYILRKLQRFITPYVAWWRKKR